MCSVSARTHQVGQLQTISTGVQQLCHNISKTIDLLWDAVGAVGAVATHSRSVPQTYPPRPQHTHSSPARVHSTTEPQLRTTLLSRCGPCLNTQWSVFNLKTILLLAKHGNGNVDKGGDIHGIRE